MINQSGVPYVIPITELLAVFPNESRYTFERSRHLALEACCPGYGLARDEDETESRQMASI